MLPLAGFPCAGSLMKLTARNARCCPRRSTSTSRSDLLAFFGSSLTQSARAKPHARMPRSGQTRVVLELFAGRTGERRADIHVWPCEPEQRTIVVVGPDAAVQIEPDHAKTEQ
jgi:hypothetical protein